MKNVPYASVVGSLIYVMVLTRQNIAPTVEVVGWFFYNMKKEHWAA